MNALSFTHISSLMSINCVKLLVKTFKTNTLYIMDTYTQKKKSAKEKCAIIKGRIQK